MGKHLSFQTAQITKVEEGDKGKTQAAWVHIPSRLINNELEKKL